MKKTGFTLWFIVTAAVLMLGGCSDNSTGSQGGGNGQQVSAKRQFIWNAMNYWYYWQSNVPKLADDHSYFKSDQDFQNYLGSFDSPRALFIDLQYDAEDDFSFFIPDYKKYNNENQGIFAALGLKYLFLTFVDQNDNPVSTVLFSQYIVPDSPADKAGVRRGEIFTKIDGKTVTANNYQSLLGDQSAHTFTYGAIKNHSVVSTDSTVTVQSVRLVEDPVFHHAVIDTNGTKIGYLVYNAFHTNTHKELNDIFGRFKSAGVQDLILDLRYNGGGALVTSDVLGSMISGRGPSDEFAELTYNDKRSDQNFTYNFMNKVPIANSDGQFDYDEEGNYADTIPMNQLSVNNVYILISQSTASASEALINGIRPYVNETLVGTKTVGKNHGEIVLYDESPPYTDVDKAEEGTKFAIAPLLLKITNKNQHDYPDGFKPRAKVDEFDYINDLPPLGSLKDPLVRKVLSLITGQPSSVSSRANLRRRALRAIPLKKTRGLHPHGDEMYVLPSTLQRVRHYQH